MVKLTNTKNVHRFVMNKNEKIKVRNVYNRIFFSSFGIDGVRIHDKDHNTEEADEDENEDEDDNDNTEGIENLFGKEKTPSGYSELPLYKKYTEEVDGSVSEKQEDVKEKSGIYEFLNDYVSSYNKKKVEEDEDNNQIVITIPFDIDNTIVPVQELTLDQEKVYDTISTTGLTYRVFEKMIQDIYLQITYLKERGYFYNEIPIDSVFFIKGRYIVLSIETVDFIPKEDEGNLKSISEPFLKFVQDLLQKKIQTILQDIQYTDIYYFLKRAQEESILLLVK